MLTEIMATEDRSRYVLVYVLCFILVSIDAARRYNTPPTNKSSTTRQSYLMSGAGYVFCVLSLYVLLSEVILLPKVLEFLVGTKVTSGSSLEWASSLPAPLLAALVMTSFLDNVPGFKQIDKQLLAFFHSIGGIPAHVRHLQNQFRPERLRLPTDLAELKSFVEDNSAIPNTAVERLRVTSGNNDRHYVRFMRNLFLYKRIYDLQAENSYSAFFDDFNKEWENVQENFKTFTDRSMIFFTVFDKIAVMRHEYTGNQDLINQVLDDTLENYRNHCADIFKELTLFLARALLRSERGQREIEGKIQSIGFNLQGMEITRPSLPIDHILLVTFAIFLMFFAVMIPVRSFWLPSIPRAAGPHDLLLFSLKMAIVYGLTITIAVLPKQRWSFARRKMDGQRPYASYLFFGLLALIMSILVNYLIDTGHELFLGPSDSRGHFQYKNYVICATSFMLCTCIAFLCDDWTTDSRKEPGWLRWAEGALGAAVMAATWLLIHAWLRRYQPLEYQPPENSNIIWPLIGLTRTSVIGFIVGISIPYLYRRNREQIETQRGRPPSGAQHVNI